ncbi:MAG: sulfite exporter TauE/SafE family protein, partial [Nitrospinae bacterium]|nr:sulfite exporter TauE/SafE family protein [Nitrospinota bacterium]
PRRRGGGGARGVGGGTTFLGHLAQSPELKAIILAIVGGIVLLSAFLNIYLMVRRIDLAKHHDLLRRLIPFFTFLIGIEVGFSSAGAGALGTLLLLSSTNLFACTVVGTDIIFGLVLSAVGGGIHLGMGNVDGPLLAELVAGGIFGALAGVQFASKVPARPLRFALLGWLIFIGSQLVYRGVAG